MPSIFYKWFNYLNAKNIDYCIVGPVDDLPDTEGDIDIVLERDTPYHNLILDFCKSAGVVPVQCLRHEVGAYYYVLWDPVSGELTKLDLCSDYVRNGRFLLSRWEILAARRPVSIGGASCFVPAPETAFLYYLVKKIDKGRLTDGQTAYLSDRWREVPEASRRNLRRFWPEPVAERIAGAAESGDWSWIRGNLALLRRCLHQRTRRMSVSTWIAEGGRVWDRLIRSTGLHVVFLGADGSGKSSVILRVAERIAPAFRRKAHFHLFPHCRKDSDRIPKPVTDPHGRPPRRPLPSLLKLALWFMRYTGGWLVHLYPARIRSTAIYFDRYYHDILVDPGRYRYGGPMWLARLVGRWIPGPDLWILLDAPAEVLQARKQEVSPEETRRQRQAYLDLVREFPNAVVVDASQPLDRVVEDSGRAILEYLARRTEKRLGVGG